MRVLSSILWLAAGLLCAATLRAAAPGPEVGRPFVRVYSPAESGATDDVPCAVQDARGMMLFGTRGAVLEFDGETWRRLPVPTKSLINSLAATDDGVVWVQADGEVGRFVPLPDGARRYESLLEKIPAAHRSRFDNTSAIAVGGRAVWLAGAGALLRWTGDSFIAYPGRDREVAKLICPERGDLIGRYADGDTFRLGAGEPQPLRDLPSLPMRFEWLSPLAGDGRWLMAVAGDALSVAEKVETASRVTRLPAAVERVRSGVRLADGGYAFLVLRGGVVLLDANLHVRAQAGVADGLPIGRANSLYADRSGGVWVCAANALVRIDDQLPETIFDAATGLERASLNVISPTRMVPLRRSDAPGTGDSAPTGLLGTRSDLLAQIYRQDGRLYAQLSNGGALTYDYEQRRFVAAPELGAALRSESSPGGTIVRDPTALKFYPTGSTDTHVWGPRTLVGSPVSADANHFVCATDETLVFVARDSAGWRSTQVPHGFNGVNLLAAGESADTWWLRGREKLERLHLEGEQIVAHEPFGAEEGVAPNSVYSFARHGRDWLALTEAGLRRFDPARRRFEPWTQLGADLADGTRFVRELCRDSSGRTWVIIQQTRRDSDSAVLLAIEPDGRRREISRDVRLRLGRLMQVVLDPEAIGGEKLWIIGFDSLACVDLARWPLTAERERIAVSLRSAQIAGGAALALTGEQVAFTETPAALQLSFAAAHFPISGRVEFRTRLEGLESSWTEWRTAATREFVNLSAGDYVFQVQARHDEATGETANYAFAVLPPWWRTSPALAAWLLGFGGAAVGLGRWRGRALRRQNEKLGRLVAARTSELTASEEQLRVARDAAEAANRAKSVFLAHMSHELRTPLNGILGYAQVLRRDPVQSEAARTRLGVIVDSGEHLLALINEVLDLAKVEAGKMELRTADVSLERLARGVADLVRARCEEKHLTFVVDVAPGLPRLVRTDEQKLRQVLLNLLGNAIKFTAQGRVTLSIAPVKDGRVRFAVEDTGPGISTERLAVLFTAFDSSTVQRGQGTGLGLVLSQRMADLLGGRIAVSSPSTELRAGVPGAGSRFWFDLPLPEVGSAEPFQRAAQRFAIGYRGARRRLLVVDDEAINRAVLRELLEPLGFAIDEAADGTAALAAARVATPDAILLDLRFMAGIDGFEIARQLRSAPELARTKVIAVSASVFESDRHEALAAGCDAFLAKPFNEEQLFALLGATLGLEWERAQPAQAAPEVAASPLADAVRVSLLELARQGDAVTLRARLAELAKAPEHAAFARELDELAASFQMKRLREKLSDADSEKTLTANPR